MREQDIIFKVVGLLESEFPGFNVHTIGREGEVEIPAITIEWSTNRLPQYQGTNPIAGYETDADGSVTGVILQRYHSMELNIEVKSYDESERDNTLSDIQDLFLPYEWDADRFHEDTTEWQVGSIRPRNNPVIEPDWYQAGILVQFHFMDEVVNNDVDALTSIQEDVNNE